jgi:hypothetical protein
MKSGESYSATRKINRQLRGNWLILNDLLEVGEEQAAMEDLERYGFDPHYVTSLEVREDGATVYGIYDFEYTRDKDGVVRFRRDQRYPPRGYR